MPKVLIVSDWTIVSALFTELPKPSLGELDDLRLWSQRVRRDRNPNVLGYTYQELLDFDSVKVELIPEKKGIIIKHVEYEVTSRVSQRFSCLQA